MSKTFKDYLEESGLQYYTGVKKHGKEYMKRAAKAGREGASQEELGRIKDKYSKAEKNKKTTENRFTKTAQNDPVMWKGKQIDLDTVDYDMDDYSDMIFNLNSAKYTDGTEVSDEDLSDLHDDPKMVDWVATDYNDAMADRADMYRDAIRHCDSESTDVDRMKELAGVSNDFVDEETYDGDDFYDAYGDLWYNEDEIMDEAEYQGRKVKLGKPMRGDVKKFKVYVRDPKTKNIKKVNFGDPNMKIKKSNPARRRSFRARHNCDNPGPRTKARYWSCRKW